MNINEHDKKEIKGCILLKDKVIIEEQEEEITRLNNIINELEKDLKEAYDCLVPNELVNGRELINNILNDLKELKEKNNGTLD